jgi:hypothetical protein
MKNVLLVSALALLGLSSCKKDWTCSCETKSVLTDQKYASIANLNGAPYNYTQDIGLTNLDKSSATTKCNEAQSGKKITDDIMNKTAVYSKTSSTCTLK